MKILIDLGPLVVFFLVNWKAGIMVGTATFMVATAVALVVAWRLERRVPVMPVVSCAFVLLFGGLTLWLEDDQFIKLKPTVFYLLLGGSLIVGHFMRRNVLKRLLGDAMNLTEEGWRTLGLRWALFFLVMAVVNEAVWRSVSTDVWVNFKVFGFLPLSLLFAATQMPLILKNQLPDPENSEAKQAP